MIFPVYVSILGREDSLFSYDFIAYDKGHRDIFKLVFNFIVFDLCHLPIYTISTAFFSKRLTQITLK